MLSTVTSYALEYQCGIALIVTLLMLLAVRAIEKRWITPASIFALVLFVHAFPAALLAANDPGFDIRNLTSVLTHSAVALVSLFTGYLLYILTQGALSQYNSNMAGRRIEPLLNQKGVRFAKRLLIVLVALQWAVLLLSGALQRGRGYNSYSGTDSAITRLAVVTQIVYPLTLALLMCMFATRTPKAKDKHFLAFAYASTLAISLMTFGRHAAMLTLCYVATYYHFRIKAIKGSGLMLAGVVVFVVSVFAGARVTGSGLLAMGPGETLTLIVEQVTDSPLSFLDGVVTSIPGQNVFSQVLNIVPARKPFQHGKTYLDSALGLIIPRVVFGGYETIDTPAYWFQRSYAPNQTSMGYDFSMLAEAYLNFGGSLAFVFVALGFAIGYLSWAICQSTDQVKIFISIIIFFAITFGLRSDSNAILKQIVYYPLPLLIIRWYGVRSYRARSTTKELRIAPPAEGEGVS